MTSEKTHEQLVKELLAKAEERSRTRPQYLPRVQELRAHTKPNLSPMPARFGSISVCSVCGWTTPR